MESFSHCPPSYFLPSKVNSPSSSSHFPPLPFLNSPSIFTSPLSLSPHPPLPPPPPPPPIPLLSLTTMGNGVAKLTQCFTPDRDGGIRCTTAAVTSEPYDGGLGHSFCYVHPDDPATFLSISGASISANTATALSTDPSVTAASSFSPSAAFESSTSFFSVPLQPIPRFSGPLGFLSGPIERSFLSGPLDHPTSLSGSLSHSGAALRRRYRRAASSLLCRFSRALRLAAKESDTTTASTTSGGTSIDLTAGESNLHWAHGKAGEDRVHVVVSELGWVFVGIYDGFNGPDATDFLLSNLYSAVQCELKGLLFEESFHLSDETHHFDCKNGTFLHVDHTQVLNAMSRALKKTEDAFLNIADQAVVENPELSLMGSCVLVMLMRGKDVYLMNVGDSRAILAQTISEELGSINEKTLNDYGERMDDLRTLSALQISLDHSTCIEEEVLRIKKEHPDDASAIANDRVKGYLKVTRAFGAGFLKQPKWNSALLEMFRIDYVGTSPYITCNPSLYHHELSSRDRFIILSSDGLYQYLTNEEAVAEAELFIATTPEGDPAQHLIEEVLFRAAKKAGMDFHELLEITQGDRRRYHDDISILVISLEGRIWRSCVNRYIG